MSNFPPNPYSNNTIGPPQMNSDNGTQIPPNNVQYAQVPRSQLPPGLPPGYIAVKPDPNSNSPLHFPAAGPQSSVQQNVSNYNESTNSSPAFNQTGKVPQQPQAHSSPMRPPIKPATINPNPTSTFSSTIPNINSNVNSPYPPNYSQQSRQINDSAPPIVSTSSQYQPFLNGPRMSGLPVSNMAPSSSPNRTLLSDTSNSSLATKPPINTSSSGLGITNLPLNQGPSTSAMFPTSGYPGQFTSQPNVPLSGPPKNSPLIQGPTVSGPAYNGMQSGAAYTGRPPQGQQSLGVNGLPSGPPQVSAAPGGNVMPPRPIAPATGPPMMSAISRPSFQPYLGPPNNGPGPRPHLNPPIMNPNVLSGPQSMPMGMQTSLPQQIGIPSPAVPPGPPSGPIGGLPKSSMQNRYPQMPQANYTNQQQPMTQQPMTQQPMMAKQYPQQYSTQAMTQQMGQLSITKQGFDQLWGHQVIDLLQCRHILPEYPDDPPEIRLGHQFAEAPNCSPEVFRCTINRIPETNSLLQKSRLPLGLLIHPFKDLNHLPVIQCTTIVRCRACRTYINPFVYFVDAKRWKCNLCYRVNELPDEFQYDPVSKSYGDPSRRPEIKSATIEFIAPGEYMLRPPQPAIYLFLLDVSQMARESGYLQVVCDTLKNSLDQLPGDARTQIGFVCYDAHVHFYLMSDHLTRPKEITVLDIDDVFLPSPESLLVNLGERRELVRELLTILPQRFSSGGCPTSALGAALQAAYKLMAPTGGRVTVFQTCLPNIGPGALQPREDPNARSSKDVAHLNPATDFYKRLALECSGAQVAVDLFLLNSQYADLATLSGMSKFSAGSVHHLPLFRSTRPGHADQLSRMLNRYLTRKIGFEAVMRVRCTRGISIHTFHGNFFVRSTDLLSLPNISPDAGFGMQLSIDESLSDLQHVCFQAALLYTSSKGERRIRVHTLALPLATTLPDVLHAADQQCIIGLLAKMAVDRCASASLTEAREALINVAVDVLAAYRVAQNAPAAAPGLPAPAALRLLPLLLLALLKRRAFRTGTSTRLDDRVADMCALKTLPLPQLVLAACPALYAVHDLADLSTPATATAPARATPRRGDEPDPPRLPLTAERINSNGAYLLDDGESMILYVGHNVSPAYLSETFGVTAFSQLPDEARSLPEIETDGNETLRALLDRLNDDRPYAASLLVLRDNSPSRTLFTERLIEDRVESAFSYYEFLQHVKTQVK